MRMKAAAAAFSVAFDNATEEAKQIYLQIIQDYQNEVSKAADDPSYCAKVDGQTMSAMEASFFTEVAKFRDYWQARAGSQGVKLDWDATARNWMRTAAERINPAPRNAPSPKTTPASAVWINRGSPQWQAWTKARGREPYVSVRNGDEGAYFRTEWPQAEGVAA